MFTTPQDHQFPNCRRLCRLGEKWSGGQQDQRLHLREGNEGSIDSIYPRKIFSQSIRDRTDNHGGCGDTRREHDAPCIWSWGEITVIFCYFQKFQVGVLLPNFTKRCCSEMLTKAVVVKAHDRACVKENCQIQQKPVIKQIKEQIQTRKFFSKISHLPLRAIYTWVWIAQNIPWKQLDFRRWYSSEGSYKLRKHKLYDEPCYSNCIACLL